MAKYQYEFFGKPGGTAVNQGGRFLRSLLQGHYRRY